MLEKYVCVCACVTHGDSVLVTFESVKMKMKDCIPNMHHIITTSAGL